MDFKSKPRVRVAIIGGGIAGLACAKALLERGAAVTVFEAGQAGKAALWASGGMLAGGFECSESNAAPAFVALAQRGMALWSDWARNLGSSGIGYRVGGVVSPAASDADMNWLEGMSARAEALNITCRRDVAIPDGLEAGTAICFPDDGEVDNRLLGPRLVDYVREAGGIIHENHAVNGFSPDGGGVRIGDQIFDAVVVATGAVGHDLAVIEPALNAIQPVKGQMLSLSGDTVALPFCLRAQKTYLSQKVDSRIVVGATSEPGQGDTFVDNAVIEALRSRAASWLPALESANLIESWAGIRPGTLDGQPILGAGALPGVFLALGLYRNGVLLAPAVAERVADAILAGGSVPAEFSASRFQQR